MEGSMPISVSTRESLLVILLIVMVAMASAGQSGRTEKPAWKDIEQQLLHQGFKTDSPSLIELAHSPEKEETRWRAIEILGLRGDRNALPVFREIAKNDGSLLLRETSALAMARLKDPNGIPLLREYVESSANKERQVYMAARLAELGDASGYHHVAEATHSKGAHVRYLAAGALIPFIPFELTNARPQIKPVGSLAGMATDKDPVVRKEVVLQFAMAVYKGASISAFEPLVAEMEKNDAAPEVRDASAGVLRLWSEMCRQQPSKDGCK
jgi:hypothetical protein